MVTFSLCMIVKNEEKVLPRCLASVSALVDEIIIVDTGSVDNTKDSAFKYTDNVFDFEWVNDFSAARNYSFSKAMSDYIIWLDADDVVDNENLQKLWNLKNTLDPNTDVVMMKYEVAFDENGKCNFSYFRERILKRECHFLWEGEVHEVISPKGVVIYSDIAITHKKIARDSEKRNLLIYESLLDKGAKLDYRQKFYYARELYYNKHYTRAVDIFLEFLALPDAWIQNKISACLDLANCYYALGEENLAFDSLLTSTRYEIRAEALCALGKHEQIKEKYENAIFWYKSALLCEKKEENGGFYSSDCYDFVPNIELAVCYDKLGNKKLANEYNELAGIIKPYDKTFLTNHEYFNTFLEESINFPT